MQQFIIQGGTTVHGTIAVSGAKNHALKLFAASILSAAPLTLRRVPEIEDINRLKEILVKLGATITHSKRGYYKIDTSTIDTTVLAPELVPQLRASIVLTGPLLARFGSVTLPHPGGCAFGKRPIDIFIAGFQAMGARLKETGNLYHWSAPHGLQGTRFVFPKISVTGTETLLMAACLARGTTTLVNTAREPEIKALADYLISQGADIRGAGTSEITITGQPQLRAGTATVIPDRIETLSFLALALASKSKLTITKCNPSDIEVPLELLRSSGVKLTTTADTITVYPWKKLQPLHITTQEFPGFPTDGQSPFTVFLTQVPGENQVTETIYSDRLFYTDTLNRMGAKIVMHTPQQVVVHGPTALRAKKVESPDLRAGIALVIAAVIAQGTTVIDNIYQIDRGYEAIDKRLRAIGVRIQRRRLS